MSLLIITLGVFLAFSRAAWGLYVFAAAMLVFIMLLKERTSAFRLKILLLALAGVALMVAAVVIALQFQKVADLFSTRTELVQSYDGGHLGRFERHRLGFMMAMEKPLGIGPLVFSTIFPEDEHNIWLKMLTSYGWLGFVSYITLIVWTVVAGFRILLRNRPWQPYLMIAWIVLVGHVGIGNVIDTDHRRHFLYGARHHLGLQGTRDELSASADPRPQLTAEPKAGNNRGQTSRYVMSYSNHRQIVEKLGELMVGAAGFEPTTP